MKAYAYRESAKFCSLSNRAVQMTDVLFPHEAMEWIESVYGKKAERIRPQTLYRMVADLCGRNAYEAEPSEIIEAVNDYLYSDETNSTENRS